MFRFRLNRTNEETVREIQYAPCRCPRKIRRGGVFVTWIGDYSPYHVHVYRDRRLVLKWDLENNVPMKGEPTRRILDPIEELRNEGLL